MTKVVPLHPTQPSAALPGYDGLTWSTRLDRTTRRWQVIGCIPGSEIPSYVLEVRRIRAGGSAEDVATQVAELLDDGRSVLPLLDD